MKFTYYDLVNGALIFDHIKRLTTLTGDCIKRLLVKYYYTVAYQKDYELFYSLVDELLDAVQRRGGQVEQGRVECQCILK